MKIKSWCAAFFFLKHIFCFKELCQPDDCRSGDCELLRLFDKSIKKTCHCPKVNWLISIVRILFKQNFFYKGVCGETCQRLCNSTSRCDTNPCWFGGTCVDVANSDYVCICPQHTTGKNCRTLSLCQSHSCHNGGTCFDSGL